MVLWDRKPVFFLQQLLLSSMIYFLIFDLGSSKHKKIDEDSANVAEKKKKKKRCLCSWKLCPLGQLKELRGQQQKEEQKCSLQSSIKACGWVQPRNN